MYSYSETPKAEPLAMREPAFLPFAPPTMSRPWTGKAPMKKKKKKKTRLFEPLGNDENEKDEDEKGKRYEMMRAYELGKFNMRPREEVLGKPLTSLEVKDMLKPYLSSNRQVNLGRDGLTHNMLELIHSHWRRQPVCKVRCLGVPTVDMNNVCWWIEEKSGGKIIHRVGGVVYVFRGRNYDHQKRPQFPVMLWKPAAPIYPKLIQDAPEGLTKEEADEFRAKGKKLLPICKLAKNGVYTTLVRDVRTAFEGSVLVKVDCRGLNPSDYKKIGAKLKELVPCVLLSFDDEQILMWRGKEWKSMYDGEGTQSIVSSPKAYAKRSVDSPKMRSLWHRAINSGKAMVMSTMDLSPDELLSKVEEFESASQAVVHSYPALIYPKGESSMTSNFQSVPDSEDEDDSYDNIDDELDSGSFEIGEFSATPGSLPVDLITRQFSDNED